MKFYVKKGKLPGDEKHPKSPSYTQIGLKMTWEQMTTGIKRIIKFFKK